MKKFVLFFLAIGLLIPLFAVPTSAASYDLGTPKLFYYTKPSGIEVENWPFNGAYIYDSVTDSVAFHVWSILPSTQLHYFLSNGPVYESYFNLGTSIPSEDVSRHIYVSGYDPLSSTLNYANTGNVRNKLLFNNLVWENLLLPINGQYLRIDASFDSALIQAPQAVLDVFSLNDLCYLCDTSGRSGYPDRYSLPIVYPSTATVSKVGNVYSYSFFFNLSIVALSSLADSDNVCLALRIPYYFNNAASFEGGVDIYSNAEIPLSYEILTVGGYDQALNDIQNSLDSLKTDLVGLYTDQSSADVGYISRGQSINSQVTNAIGDYNDSLKPLDSMRNDYTAPPAAQQVQQQLSSLDTDKVKTFFSVPWIVSALGLVFTFSVIRLILYGTKEG